MRSWQCADNRDHCHDEIELKRSEIDHIRDRIHIVLPLRRTTTPAKRLLVCNAQEQESPAKHPIARDPPCPAFRSSYKLCRKRGRISYACNHERSCSDCTTAPIEILLVSCSTLISHRRSSLPYTTIQSLGTVSIGNKPGHGPRSADRLWCWSRTDRSYESELQDSTPLFTMTA